MQPSTWDMELSLPFLLGGPRNEAVLFLTSEAAPTSGGMGILTCPVPQLRAPREGRELND